MTLRLMLAALAVSARAGLWATAVDPVAPSSKLFEAGQYGQVISQLSPEALQRLRGNNLARAYGILGLSYERVNRTDAALGVYQLGVKLFPRDLNLLTQLAGLLHRSGLEERAEPLFQKVLLIHPNNAAAHLGLAEIDHALGFLDRSAEHYEKSLETADKQAPVWCDYGDVLLEMRDHKTAELAYRQSLKLAPSAPAALGLAYALRGEGKLAEALDLLANLAEPTPAVKSLRGLWLLEAGRENEALAAVESVLAADGSDALARYIRARVRLKQDRYNDAVGDLKAAAGDPRL
jgi:tetratricopeptide (TPR) repeat protein